MTKFERSKEVNDEHSQNITPIAVTWEVVKFEKLTAVILQQLLNIFAKLFILSYHINLISLSVSLNYNHK